MVTVGRKATYAITPFDIKIIFNRRLKPSSSINEISSIMPRMIDWKVPYLQENHADGVQLPLFKALPIKKKSFQCIKIVKDVNQQPSNLSAVESLVV